METIQDVLGQNLSGGQKRKLTFGIAILGDPQVNSTKITGEIELNPVKLLYSIRLSMINVREPLPGKIKYQDIFPDNV